jgi:hypothetical protein
MEFAELAFQNIAGFAQTGRLPLKSGLNALVSTETDLFEVLRALFAPGTEDTSVLAGPTTPRKIAITIRADDGNSYRLVRDLDAGRTLLKSDPATRKAIKISDDEREIERALMAIARIPPPEILEQHFWLSKALLPGRAAAEVSKATADGGTAPVISPEDARRRIPELEAELARAEQFEQAQDSVYELQQQLAEYAKALGGLSELEGQIQELTRKVDSYGRFQELGPGIEVRIKKYPEAIARRDAGMAEVRKKRAELENNLSAVPDFSGLLKDQIFLGGAVAGIVCVAAAVYFMKPWLWLTDLVGFGVAAFGALRWVGAVETADRDHRRLADLNEL